MGRKKISVDQLRSEVNKILEQYVDDVDTALEEASLQYAKIGKAELRQDSPVGKETAKPGHYAAGWAYKKVKGKLSVTATVHNRTDYSLTHLLENGHALRQGGRSPAIKHIGPVDEKIARDFEKNVRERLENMR